jgi:7-carboxy-7-deazaguanine synthase
MIPFPGMSMKINEIFYSIQGESSFMGRPCVFVRLTACNLRCSYCDTRYAFHEGKEMSVAEIVEAAAAYPTRLALVTGGEPLLQNSVHDLFRELLEREYTVCVETGGHMPVGGIDGRVRKIMDFKCPSSGMMAHNDYSNVGHLTRNDEVKFVVGDHVDFDWACGVIRSYDLPRKAGTVLLSPVYDKLRYDLLARWVLDCGLDVRMQLQMHRVIWPDILRGV